MLISPTEATDLLTHLKLRPDIWYYAHGAWFRTTKTGTRKLALMLKNGLENQMSVLTYKPITDTPSEAHAYVCWLLRNYTDYETRQTILNELKAHAKRNTDLDALSYKIFCSVTE